MLQQFLVIFQVIVHIPDNCLSRHAEFEGLFTTENIQKSFGKLHM